MEGKAAVSGAKSYARRHHIWIIGALILGKTWTEWDAKSNLRILTTHSDRLIVSQIQAVEHQPYY